MAHRFQKYLISLFAVGITLTGLSAKAQIISSKQLIANNSAFKPKNRIDTAYINNSKIDDNYNPINFSSVELSNTRDKKRLLTYLKQLNVPEDVDRYQSRQKFYYHLANVFAHLRLYPLAMKCFLKTQVKDQIPQPLQDSLQQTDAVLLNSDNLNPNTKDDSVVEKRVLSPDNNIGEKKSKEIACNNILNIFNDGKTAVAYAMLFHVKQPMRGKRKIFVWANTGHTFITLIKYNSDSTFVSASFGFYPHKDGLLSATPLVPSSTSTFKDDSGHIWDEVLGKFISRRRFDKILYLTKNYADMKYHLSNNNCTDFGIHAAEIAGISVTNTKGKWPLGSGNNPAITGQSIIEGKYKDLDTKEIGNLFVSKD
jgi:hypothetical protein